MDCECIVELKRNVSIIIYKYVLKDKICEILDEMGVNNINEVVVKVKIVSKDKSLLFLDVNNNIILSVCLFDIFPVYTNEFIQSFISVMKKYI